MDALGIIIHQTRIRALGQRMATGIACQRTYPVNAAEFATAMSHKRDAVRSEPATYMFATEFKGAGSAGTTIVCCCCPRATEKSTRAPRCRVPLPQPPVASCIVLEPLPLRAQQRPECLPECTRTLLCRHQPYTRAILLHSPSRTCSLECKTRTGAMMKRCVLCAGADHPRCSC